MTTIWITVGKVLAKAAVLLLRAALWASTHREVLAIAAQGLGQPDLAAHLRENTP